MPIYEYTCHDCQKASEFLIGVTSAKEKIQCKHCGSKKMAKKISGAFVSTGAKSKQEYCGQKGPCQTPACLYGKGCHE
ncbi:MAG: zinc ribbon domain-containing protein [Candidatus Omnitrophica bacterium]|nr:zinc ribbon domain-containing protein [Candidatus Omnitrophota bacterium]